MSDVTQFANLYPRLIQELPAAPDLPLVVQALQRSCRDFCKLTDSWREWLAPLVVVDFQEDYAVSLDYDADLRRIVELKLQGSRRADCEFELYREGHFRFRGGWAPHDCDSQLLKCGPMQTTVATWQAVTSGAFTMVINSSTYNVTGLSFASVVTLDDVARVIQNGIRAEMDDNVVWVRKYGLTTAQRLYIWTESGELGYLTAPSSGTDITGSGFMNGLSGGTGVSKGGRIEVFVSLVPDYNVDGLPDWFLNRYDEGIIAGAAAILMATAGKPWSSQEGAIEAKGRYNSAITEAIAEIGMDFKESSDGFWA